MSGIDPAMPADLGRYLRSLESRIGELERAADWANVVEARAVSITFTSGTHTAVDFETPWPSAPVLTLIPRSASTADYFSVHVSTVTATQFNCVLFRNGTAHTGVLSVTLIARLST